MDPESKNEEPNSNDEYTKPSERQRKFGAYILGAAVVGFIGLIFIPKDAGWINGGEVAAISMLFVMLGLAFFLPQLLAVPDGQGYSTMRVVVFVVVAVFVITSVKIGWNAESFDDFTIDRSWLYILGLAFGSKVFQSFAEEDEKEEK